MNQQCKVCGEPAAGFHFGAFTCEGCKSFFGRTSNNQNSIPECKNNGECVINKKNRTSCKACRLKKCLMVGMSKSGSRYGRRSNWFKIHCLLQEQQQAQMLHHKSGGSVLAGGSAESIMCGSPRNVSTHEKNAWTYMESKCKAESDSENLSHMESKSFAPSTPPGLTLSPMHFSLPGYSVDPTSAAVFWAQARKSLLQLQSSHLPMQVPYHNQQFTTTPAFHTYQPKGFHMTLPAGDAHIPRSPWTPSVSETRDSDTPDGCGRSSAISVGYSSDGMSPPTSPSSASELSSAMPASHHSTSPMEVASDHPEPTVSASEAASAVIEKLRSLGPMQEHPLDLSMRRPSPVPHKSSNASVEDEEEPQNMTTNVDRRMDCSKRRLEATPQEQNTKSSPNGIDDSGMTCVMSSLLLHNVYSCESRSLYSRSKSDATALLTFILCFSLILFIL